MSDYEVVWSGAMRRYLSPTLDPATVPVTPQTPSQPPLQTRGWLAGEHLRPYDLPRLRLRSSLQAAPGRFTVKGFAVASRVSVSKARSYLAEMIAAGEARPVNVATGRAMTYERVSEGPASVP